MDGNKAKKSTRILNNYWQVFFKFITHCAPIVKAMEYMSYFGVSFFLSRAVIFSTCAPFGAAFCAACGAGFNAVLGLIGATCGYLSIIYHANGLKYIAICVLVFTAGFVFKDTTIYKKRWFIPTAATISCAVIGFIFVIDYGFSIYEIALYISEVCIVAICSYFYRIKSPTRLRYTGAILLITTLVISLVPIRLWNAVSIGGAVASLLIMLSGYYGGISAGSIAGIVLALSVCAGGGEVYLCAIYGFCGLFSAIFREKGRIAFLVVYLICNVVCMLWITTRINLALIYEAFFASVLFIPVCEMFGAQIKELSTVNITPENSGYTERIRRFAKTKLNRASIAFKQLALTVDNSFHKKNKEPLSLTNIFEEPINCVCKKCVLSSNCWEQQYVTTREALNDATLAMQKHGRLSPNHFPNHFSSRCIHIEDFITSVNNAYTRFLYRKQCTTRVEESRAMLRKQYRDLSNVFEEFSNELSVSPQFDGEAEKKLSSLFARENIAATPWVYRDRANHIRVQIEGDDLSYLMKRPEVLQSSISDILNLPLTYPRINESRTSITLRQREPMYATIGVAVHKKEGNKISGDSGSYFRTDEGKLCVILADGMGSGESAAKISAQAISLLERFLQSGIAPNLALKIINSALMLKGECDGAFTTIDFMQSDLYTGQTDFYKLGSAPSYIKRGKNIKRLCGNRLPAGVPCAETNTDTFHQHLQFGDFIIFATDGIADKNDDSWLVNLISDFDGSGAKQLSSEIMAGACAKYGYSDDMSVLVVRLDKNS